jgi:hypothetical protein
MRYRLRVGSRNVNYRSVNINKDVKNDPESVTNLVRDKNYRIGGFGSLESLSRTRQNNESV